MWRHLECLNQLLNTQDLIIIGNIVVKFGMTPFLKTHEKIQMKFDLNENEINKCVVIFKIASPRLTLTFIVYKIPKKIPINLKK